MSEDQVISFLRSCEGAVIGTEPVTERVIASLPGLRIYAKYGVGLDNLNLEALSRRGITVGWTGGVNRRSVSELALWFMLSICRKTALTSAALSRGSWQKDGGSLLSGRTIGIVGCGFVGTDLLALLEPFGGGRLIADIEDKSETAGRFGAQQVPYEELLRLSDIVSFHVPLTEKSRQMFAEPEIQKMRPGAIVINTSRGAVLDQEALKRALQSGRLQAGLDVFAEEPPKDLALLSLPGLVATPHVGGNAVEAVLAMGRSAIGHLNAFFRP